MKKPPADRIVLQLAEEEARGFNHEYIGTEHLLLGLLRTGCGIAAEVIDSFRVEPRRIRQEVLRIIQEGPQMMSLDRLPRTPRAHQALRYAEEEARNFPLGQVDTGAILLGLLRETANVAAQVLMNVGVKPDQVRGKVVEAWQRPVIESSWLTWNNGTVLKMACTIEEERRWEDLPVLADALQDGGCGELVTLDHLRSRGNHLWGCWVLDRLLLGNGYAGISS